MFIQTYHYNICISFTKSTQNKPNEIEDELVHLQPTKDDIKEKSLDVEVQQTQDEVGSDRPLEVRAEQPEHIIQEEVEDVLLQEESIAGDPIANVISQEQPTTECQPSHQASSLKEDQNVTTTPDVNKKKEKRVKRTREHQNEIKTDTPKQQSEDNKDYQSNQNTLNTDQPIETPIPTEPSNISNISPSDDKPKDLPKSILKDNTGYDANQIAEPEIIKEEPKQESKVIKTSQTRNLSTQETKSVDKSKLKPETQVNLDIEIIKNSLSLKIFSNERCYVLFNRYQRLRRKRCLQQLLQHLLMKLMPKSNSQLKFLKRSR